MFCGKCGNQIPDGNKFCGKCGAPVQVQAAAPAAPQAAPVNQIQPSQPVYPVQNTPVYSPTPNTYPPKKGNMLLTVILAVLCVGLLVAGGIFIYDRLTNGSEDADTEDRSSSRSNNKAAGLILGKNDSDASNDEESNSNDNNSPDESSSDVNDNDNSSNNDDSTSSDNSSGNDSSSNNSSSSGNEGSSKSDTYGQINVDINGESKTLKCFEACYEYNGEYIVYFQQRSGSNRCSLYVALPTDVSGGDSFTAQDAAISASIDMPIVTVMYYPEDGSEPYSYVSNYGDSSFSLSIDQWDGVGGVCKGTFDGKIELGADDIVFDNGEFEFNIK